MRFLVSIHHPDDYDASLHEDEARRRAIDALNDEMVAAGVRVFVGGLHRVHTAVALVAEGGEVMARPGAYLPGAEHVAGFWVLDVADLEEALNWGRKAVVACDAPVEVRAFHG
jgi:hypothetical protein